MFGYPPNLEEKKKEDKEKVTTAVLSITNKRRRKKDGTGEEKMDVDSEKKDDKKEKMEVDEKKEEEKKEEVKPEEEKEPEALYEMLSNPARVMKAQLKVINLDDGKYRPMKDISIGGIVMLDRAELGADDEEQIVEPMEVNKGASTTAEEEGEEPSPPEPFQWTED